MHHSSTASPNLDYKKTIFTLIEDLRRLQEFGQKLKLETSITSINTLLQKMERDCFSIGVVGEFNRGKSTFINAILGQEILPSDILATTATISRITHRSNPGA